jgi:outer membrane receptor protein involved in Fe transport
LHRVFSAAIVTMAAFLALIQPAVADVTGVVRGSVVRDGRPLAGTTVTASSAGAHLTTVTDPNGGFVFARLPFGRWTLAASSGDFSATATVDVASDSVADVRLALASRTIGATRATSLSVGGTPVSAVTLTGAQLAAAPQNQNLNRIIETTPGIVRFSYDEPVAHGFHGVNYEIDGAPIPQTTSTSFSQIFDPRNIDSLEVLTGAFPAEFGGQRMGALVNIVTKRDVDIPNGSQTVISPGFGSYGTAQINLSQATKLGPTDLFFNANVQSNDRGLDPPSSQIVHDAAGLSDQFLRTVTRLGPQDTLAFDVSNQFNTYQIPINLTQTAVDTIVNLPGQDDVQLEYNSFANLNYTHTYEDGNGYLQVIPWWRSTRTIYAGDLANDVQALDYSSDDCAPAAPPCALAGLSQNRAANVYGLRAAYARDSSVHAFKFGVDGSFESFNSVETIALAGSPNFTDNVVKTGTTFDAYAQDTWTPNPEVSVAAGLRYDLSDGFVGGNLLQPRIGVNVRLGPDTIAHLYYGRLYAAPNLEDTRRAAVVVGGGDPAALPVYDLKPMTESYYEAGLAHTFGSDLQAWADVWERNVWNVLDTTQIYPTPLFAVYNNSLGLAHGVELRLQQRARTGDWYLSASFSQSVAGGISGGTFLFPPDQISDTSLQPEDHDQALAVNGAYTEHFGRSNRWYATAGTEYGTGYPVAFQNGNGRLTPHLTFDGTLGVTPQKNAWGFRVSALNLGDYRYVVKVNNGFNTTQYAPGLQLLVEGQVLF